MNAPQDMLDAAGVQAAHIADLWWLMVAVCTFVLVAVVVALLIALWRAPRSTVSTPPDLSPFRVGERRANVMVSAAVGLSTLALIGLIAASVATDRALAKLPLAANGENAVHIEVVANQWWWDARYHANDPERRFTTANELHIPVGRPILMTLKSNDVIHSFWVPNLAGKKDLIPGRTATLQFQADRPGTYRGQCAEFCGHQHAFMAFLVIAEPAEAYARWAEQQHRPAREPQADAERRGRDVFLSRSCMLCHAIEGTPANARRAPDLTHIAGRRTLAAGTLPNEPEKLAQWILDPQSVKPGTTMPATELSSDELQGLVAYLRSLE